MANKHPTLGNTVHSETEAEAIIKRNSSRQTKEDRRKRDVRRAIEARKEAKELGVDVEDLF